MNSVRIEDVNRRFVEIPTREIWLAVCLYAKRFSNEDLRLIEFDAMMELRDRYEDEEAVETDPESWYSKRGKELSKHGLPL